MAGRSAAVFAVAVLALAAAPLGASPYWVGLLTQMIIFALLAMSLDILLGYTGLPSLGHAGIFGVAAYGVAVASTVYHLGLWGSILVALLAGTLVSGLSGLIVSHVRDVYFLMITLALGMVLWGVSYRWIPMTGGDNGLSGIPRLEAYLGPAAAGPTSFYYVALLVFLVTGGVLMLLVRSPFGYTLIGIRENEPRMRSLGFNTWLHCYLAYVLSGIVASVAGVVWAYYNGFVSPTYLDLTASSELFLMVTLGGPGTLAGPALGAGAIVLLKNVISAYTQRWLLVLGIVYIAAMLVAPDGLWNVRRRRTLAGPPG
jgi:branched-chain amino acid transport system permease protein